MHSFRLFFSEFAHWESIRSYEIESVTKPSVKSSVSIPVGKITKKIVWKIAFL